MGRIRRQFDAETALGRADGIAKIDSGADVTLFRRDVGAKLGIDVAEGEAIVLGGVGGRVLAIQVPATVTVGRASAKIDVAVPFARVDETNESLSPIAQKENLIGHDFLQATRSKIDFSRPLDDAFEGGEGRIDDVVLLPITPSLERKFRAWLRQQPDLRKPHPARGISKRKDVAKRARGSSGASRQHARKKSPAQLQREIDEVLAKPLTASKETSVLPPSVRVARVGLESVRKQGIKNLRYGLYRHAGDRAYQWGNFTGTPEHVITAVVPNDKNTASQEALVRALKWKR